MCSRKTKRSSPAIRIVPTQGYSRPLKAVWYSATATIKSPVIYPSVARPDSNSYDASKDTSCTSSISRCATCRALWAHEARSRKGRFDLPGRRKIADAGGELINTVTDGGVAVLQQFHLFFGRFRARFGDLGAVFFGANRTLCARGVLICRVPLRRRFGKPVLQIVDGLFVVLDSRNQVVENVLAVLSQADERFKLRDDIVVATGLCHEVGRDS